MNKIYIALGLVTLIGCGSSTPAGSSGAGGSGEAGLSPGNGASGGSSTVCVAGQQVACACPGGIEGAQACKADGSGYLACACAMNGVGGSTAGGSAGMGNAGGGAGAGGDAGTGEAGGTAGASGSGNGGVGGSAGGGVSGGGTSGGGTTSGGGSSGGGSSGSAGAGAAGCPPIESYGPLSYDNTNSGAQLLNLPPPPNNELVAWSGTDALFVGHPLVVQLFNDASPFGTTITSKSIDLRTQALLKTCGACVLLGDPSAPHPPYDVANPYIATSGTLVITAVPAFPSSGTGQNLSATLSNVTFEHVHIDPNTGDQTKVDDCKVTVSSAAIRSVLVVPPMCSSNADCSAPMPTCTGVYCGGCDPVSGGGCTGGLGCVPTGPAGPVVVFGCDTPGSLAVGARCDSGGTCVPGATCVLDAQDTSGARYCMKNCSTTNPTDCLVCDKTGPSGGTAWPPNFGVCKS